MGLQQKLDHVCRKARTSLLWLGVFVYIFVLPQRIGSDGYARFQMLVDLLKHGQISNSQYSIVQPLLTAPLWVLGRLFDNAPLACALFNKLVFLAGLGAIFLLLRKRIRTDVLQSLILLLMTASMFPHHVQTYFGEVLTTVLVTVGLLCLCTDREKAGIASLVVGAANSPAATGSLLLGSLPFAWYRRKWRIAVLPVALVAVVVMAECWIKRGSPISTGYEGNHGDTTLLPYSGRPGFSYPFALGVMSIFFSFGKGIMFFAPGLWLLFKRPSAAPPEALERFRRACALFLLGLVLVYSKWWSWYGGWFWGPRFFLFASVPSCLMLALHLSDAHAKLTMRCVTLTLLAASVWVGISGAVFGQYGLTADRENHYALEYLVWYVLEYSVLVRPFITPKPLAARDIVIICYFACVGICLGAPTARGVFASLTTFSKGLLIRLRNRGGDQSQP